MEVSNVMRLALDFDFSEEELRHVDLTLSSWITLGFQRQSRGSDSWEGEGAVDDQCILCRVQCPQRSTALAGSALLTVDLNHIHSVLPLS